MTNQTNIPFNLNHGAIGIDKKFHRTALIEPCGKDGIYVKYCHVKFSQHTVDGEGASGIRTIDAIHEDEIFEWFHDVAGIPTDTFEWHPAAMEPKPDTYRLDKILEEEKAIKEKKALAADKKVRAAERKSRRYFTC